MTDKEVSKLSRKDLLEFLLDAQTENETLRKERSDLRKQLKEMEEDLIKAKASVSDTDRQAVLLLQEARVAADNAATSQREHQAAQEQRLQEWELRLQERDGHLSDQEEAAKKLMTAVARVSPAPRSAPAVTNWLHCTGWITATLKFPFAR